MLHSNPGDYAWGQGGLDAVITQVNQTYFNYIPTVFLSPFNFSSVYKYVCVFSY